MEIKEILNRLEKIGYYASVPKELAYMTTNITPQECKTILDYITNLEKENEKWFAVAKDFEMEAHDLWFKNNELEQENERLKKLDENYPIEEELAEAYRREEDYKSKIEKAVEYIENTPLYETTYDYNMEEELEIQNVSDETASNKLLEILNGRSDE